MRILLTVLMLLSPTALAEKWVEFSGLAISDHSKGGYVDFDGSSKKFNNNHNLLGLELRNLTDGYSIANFKNSFYTNSTLVTYNRYVALSSVEVVAGVGLITGYENRPTCKLPIGSTCGLVTLGIQYTKLDFKPRLTILGNALVLSINMEL